jgi:hypothetical protein
MTIVPRRLGRAAQVSGPSMHAVVTSTLCLLRGPFCRSHRDAGKPLQQRDRSEPVIAVAMRDVNLAQFAVSALQSTVGFFSSVSNHGDTAKTAAGSGRPVARGPQPGTSSFSPLPSVNTMNADSRGLLLAYEPSVLPR